jgi:hypothetical protein
VRIISTFGDAFAAISENSFMLNVGVESIVVDGAGSFVEVSRNTGLANGNTGRIFCTNGGHLTTFDNNAAAILCTDGMLTHL